MISLSELVFPETYRFKKMLIGNVDCSGKVGDGAGNFQYPAVSPGAEFEAVDRIAQQSFSGVSQGAELLQSFGSKLIVAEKSGCGLRIC